MDDGYSLLNKKILVTGSAGFIGCFLAKRLLELDCVVLGIDNLNDYYDASLKHARLKLLESYKQFRFVKADISDKDRMMELFEEFKPDMVAHLAAQAGVRYSIENPDAYVKSNIVGFFNILEACRRFKPEHLVYASSSSVYGNNQKVPFAETDFVDKPISLYAATKKSNELMAHTYSYLYDIPATGLRFFTVYGPMGRPDMAYFSFTDSYFRGEPIKIYNNGDFDNDLYRDFTYIDDIVEGIIRLLAQPPALSGDGAAHRLYNIGNNQPVKLMQFIETLENSIGNALNRKVEFDKIFEPHKPGDVRATFASIDSLHEDTGFKPSTSLEEGLQKFAEWYVKYHGIR